MKNSTLFWTGWVVWIFMVIVKFILVFNDFDFQWDPLFFIPVYGMLLYGGMPKDNNKKDKE